MFSNIGKLPITFKFTFSCISSPSRDECFVYVIAVIGNKRFSKND